MSFLPKVEALSENKKDGLLNQILAKYKESKDSNFLQIAIHHLKVYEKYLKLVEEKGPAAFPNRLEYQKFTAAKLFIDRITLFEFSVDPSTKGFKEYKEERLPPLDAFNCHEDIKETRKMKFCHNIEKGDILHLRVIEKQSEKYKLLVLNKFEEKERVADYSLHAFMMISPQLSALPKPLEIGDLVRATVLGKLKLEGKVFSKLLVTLNKNFNCEKYKDVPLGQVFKSDIAYYPEDISEYTSLIEYMADQDSDGDQEDIVKRMSSLGIDPYKTYSFHGARDGKKLGKPKEIEISDLQLKKMDQSMDLLKNAEKQLLKDNDFKSVLPIIDAVLEIYPQNDAAYGFRAQVWNRLFISENDTDFILKALQDCEKALELNTYNITATRVYLTIIYLSSELYKDEGNQAKADELMDIINRTKDVCDVTKLFTRSAEEDDPQQSTTAEAQSGAVPMDLAE